jgi:hypothetical protein
MKALVWVLLVLTAVVIEAELIAWCRPLQRWLIRKAAAPLPKQERDRYIEEWYRELEELPNGPVTRLSWVLFLLIRRRSLARAVAVSPDKPSAPEPKVSRFAAARRRFTRRAVAGQIGAAAMFILLVLVVYRWETRGVLAIYAVYAAYLAVVLFIVFVFKMLNLYHRWAGRRRWKLILRSSHRRGNLSHLGRTPHALMMSKKAHASVWGAPGKRAAVPGAYRGRRTETRP